MAKKASPHRRLIITKNLILMLVMLVIVFLATMAWFGAKPSANASGLSVGTKGAGDIQVALPYKGSYPLDTDSEDYRFKESINFASSQCFSGSLFSDVTSDGKTFIIPTFEADKENKKDGRTVVPAGGWEFAQSSKEVRTDENTDNDDKFDYVSLDFYLRSSVPDVNVAGTSFLAALSDISDPAKPLKVDNVNDIGNLDRNNIIYGGGKFSSDAIVGAMRVSLVVQNVVGQTSSGSGENETRSDSYQQVNNSDKPEELRFTWLPRPDILLNTDNSYSNWSLITGITPNNASYGKKTFSHSFYGVDLTKLDSNNNLIKQGVTLTRYYDNDIANSISNSNLKQDYKDGATNPGYFHVSSVTGNNVGGTGYYPTLGSNCSLTSDDGQDPVTFTDSNNVQKDYYVFKMTLNIWIEGVDAEARRSMGDGQFKMNLDFC